MSTATHPFTEQGLRSLPAPIVDKLRELIARVRRIALLKGIFAVAAVALGCVLAIMAVDAAVTIFSPAIRWSLTLTGLAITGLAAWWWVVRPATKRITLTSIARFVEDRHPELQETISSSVELLASDDPDEIRGSQELITEVVKTAIHDVDSVSPKDEFDARPIRQYATAAIVLMGVLALVLAIWPKPAGVLLTRAIAPFLEVGNAYADTMEVTPGDIRIPRGEDLTVEMTIRHRRIERATVRRLDEDRKEEGVERMTYLEGEDPALKRFVLTFPNVQKDFQYRVHAGNALSRYFNVEVVPPPAVDELSIRYDFPEYTGLEPVEAVSENGEIVALENTKVTVIAKLNRPMKEVALMIGKNAQKLIEEEGRKQDPNIKKWQFILRRDQESDWSIQLKDDYGFESEPKYYQLRSVRDKVPTIELDAPIAKELKLKPTEFLPILYTAKEDFGFSGAHLVIRHDGRDPAEEIVQKLPEGSSANGIWSGKAPLNLASLDLERTRNLTVQVRIADNLPEHYKGSQKALSEPIKIQLDRNAKSLAEQTFEAQEREIREELEAAKRDLNEARQKDLSAKARMLREEEMSPEAMADMDKARQEITEAEERLTELAEKMENTVFNERAQEMKKIAEENVQPAREMAETIPLTDEKEERVAQAEEVAEQVEEAMKEIDEVLRNLRESEDDVERVAELAEMANNQERLAQEAAENAREQMEQEQAIEAGELDPNSREAQEAAREQQQEMQAFQREQQNMQRELGEMLREDPEAMQQVMEQQQQNAERMAQEAQQLAEEQADLREAAEQAANPEVANPDMLAELQNDILEQLQREQQQIANDSQAARERMQEQQEQAQAQNPEAANQPQNQARQEAREQAMQEATENAQEAARELAQADIEAAQQAAEEAAEAFENMAEQALAEMAGEEPAMQAQNEPGQPEPGQPEAGQPEPGQPQPGQPEAGQPEAGQPEAGQPQPGEPGQMAQQGQQPPADPQMAAELSELSERQERVAETLDAIERGQLEEALAMMQEAIAQEAEALTQQAEAMQQAAAETRQSQPRSQAQRAEQQFAQAESQAQRAAQALAQAQQQQDAAQAAPAQQAAREQGMNPQEAQAQAMEQAQSGELPAAQPNANEQRALAQAQQAQQASQQALEQAAQQLSQAAQQFGQQAQAMAQAAQQQEQSENRMVDPQDLAESFEQTAQAAQQAQQSAQSQQTAQAAAQAMQAAEALQQMAQQAAESMGAMSQSQPLTNSQMAQSQQGQPSMPSEQPSSNPMEQAGPDADADASGVPPELAKLGISKADWARMKGTLKSDITNEGGTGAPEEYQSLVNQYFRIIAAEARKKD